MESGLSLNSELTLVLMEKAAVKRSSMSSEYDLWIIILCMLLCEIILLIYMYVIDNKKLIFMYVM